jgi:hypothetical protein
MTLGRAGSKHCRKVSIGRGGLEQQLRSTCWRPVPAVARWATGAEARQAAETAPVRQSSRSTASFQPLPDLLSRQQTLICPTYENPAVLSMVQAVTAVGRGCGYVKSTHDAS